MDRFIQLFTQFGLFLEKFAWTYVDRFIPEAREGYPYVMWDQIDPLPAGVTNRAFPAASFANPTTDEMVVDFFRFEMTPATTGWAAGGLNVMGGAQDFNVRVTIKDLAHNAPLMQQSVPVGLLIDPVTRRYYPTRRIVLPGGNQSALQITLDNLTGGDLAHCYVAAHCHARTRKNTPQ